MGHHNAEFEHLIIIRQRIITVGSALLASGRTKLVITTCCWVYVDVQHVLLVRMITE